MPNNTIKGLTVEIGGDTTKLGKAMEDINKKSGNLSKELSDINRLLKLDPGNTELVSQKQKVLAEAISNTRARLETLKEAERQVQAQFERGEVSEAQYRALQREVIATENKLKGYTGALKETEEAQHGAAKSTKEFGDEAEKSGDKALKLGDIIKANLISDAIKAGLSALASGLKAVGKSAVESYADYEQLVGGVDTLFKDSSGKVQEYADNAYKTAGLSANAYMETVTSFSASLISSLGGDTAKAAEYADMAITDMSDNANKMGTDIASIQNAYQGFAKQNYTMLDNLKLGYGGTKTEMERLLADAEAISGVHYDVSSYADVVDAIHVIQTEIGITGTTALEAEKTISGSINTLKGSLTNLVAGLGNADADVASLAQNVIDAFVNVLNNITPVADHVIAALPTVLDSLLVAIQERLPYILEQGAELLETLLQGISDNRDRIVSTALNVVMTLVGVLLDNLPAILEMGIQILVSLISGIASALPELIPQIVDCVLLICETLIDNLDLLVDSGIELIMALADGLLKALPRLIDKAPVLIEKLINAITNNLPKIIEMGIQLTVQLAVGIIKAIPQLVSKLPQIISAILTGLGEGLKSVGEIGLNLVKGLWNGIKDATSWVLDKIKGFGQSILNGIKNIFGIHSPSKEMAWVGKMLDEGLAEGVEKYADEPLDAMTDLSKGILEEAEGLNGIVLDRQLQTSASNAAAAAADNGLLGKLDRILSAIEAGQILTIDGDALVGATAKKYDGALGQRRLLAARGAI